MVDLTSATPKTLLVGTILALAAGFGSTGHARSWIENRSLSFDTTLDTSVGVVRDEQVFARSWRQAPLIQSLGLPESVELAAIASQSGDTYLVTDISYTLSGQLVTPRDIVRRTAAGVSTIFLRGADLGLPSTSRIVSLAFDGTDVLFSLDTAATIASTTVKPSDLLRWNGVLVSVAYSGATMGIPDGVRISALERLTSGRLLLALDTHVQIGGISASPGDILEFNPVGAQWEINRSSDSLGVICQPCKIVAISADGSTDVIGRAGFENYED